MAHANGKKGADGERLAAEYLAAKGYEILNMNYRTRHGEIDIIAKTGDTIVFVEVKYRSGLIFGHPEDAVNETKKRKIALTAIRYSLEHGQDCYFRFDVITLFGKNNDLKHIEAAFTLDGMKLG